MCAKVKCDSEALGRLKRGHATTTYDFCGFVGFGFVLQILFVRRRRYYDDTSL